MATADTQREIESLQLQEAEAWFEYLEVTQEDRARYDEVEPWAYARLERRLNLIVNKKQRLTPAVT